MSRGVGIVSALLAGICIGSVVARFSDGEVKAASPLITAVAAVSSDDLFVVQNGRVARCRYTSGVKWTCRDQELGQ